jgi:hypothetical protein
MLMAVDNFNFSHKPTAPKGKRRETIIYPTPKSFVKSGSEKTSQILGFLRLSKEPSGLRGINWYRLIQRFLFSDKRPPERDTTIMFWPKGVLTLSPGLNMGRVAAACPISVGWGELLAMVDVEPYIVFVALYQAEANKFIWVAFFIMGRFAGALPVKKNVLSSISANSRREHCSWCCWLVPGAISTGTRLRSLSICAEHCSKAAFQ